MVGSIQYIPGRRLDPGVFFSNRATSRRLRTFPERRRVLSNAWCANHTRVVYAGAILPMRFVPAGKMVDFSACTVYFGEGRVAELQNFSWETRENWFRQTRRRNREGSISVWWSHILVSEKLWETDYLPFVPACVVMNVSISGVVERNV